MASFVGSGYLCAIVGLRANEVGVAYMCLEYSDVGYGYFRVVAVNPVLVVATSVWLQLFQC